MAVLRRMRDDVAYFAKICFTKGEGWLYEPGDLADYQHQIYDLIEQKDEKTLILVPRFHNKTTLISKIYVLHQIIFKHVEYVALFSSTDKNKRGVATNHRNALTDAFKFEELHYFLPYLFPGGNILAKANETELVLTNGARIEYVAIFGEVRGLSSAGRPDLIVLDDIIPSTARFSEIDRNHVLDTWLSSIRFIGRQGARFIGVGTVVHSDDIWAMIADGRMGGWSFLRFAAYDANAEPDKIAETILWPERYTFESLMKIREEEYVRTNREHLWAAEMLNDPATAETHPFSGTMFKYFDWNPGDLRLTYDAQILSAESMYRVIWVDHSQGTGNDDFVVMETWTDYRGNIYPVKLYTSKIDSVGERIRVVKKFLFDRKPHKFGIEKTSESMTFIDVLRAELRRAGLEMRIETPTPQAFGAKIDRITDRLTPKYEAGKLVHPSKLIKRFDGISDKIEDQLKRFDKTRKNNRDDIIDCLAWSVIFSRTPEIPEVELTIPEDSLYNMRVRIHETIKKQQEANEPFGEDLPDEPWPMIRGVC